LRSGSLSNGRGPWAQPPARIGERKMIAIKSSLWSNRSRRGHAILDMRARSDGFSRHSGAKPYPGLRCLLGLAASAFGLRSGRLASPRDPWLRLLPPIRPAPTIPARRARFGLNFPNPVGHGRRFRQKRQRRMPLLRWVFGFCRERSVTRSRSWQSRRGCFRLERDEGPLSTAWVSQPALTQCSALANRSHRGIGRR